jgi:hypothetical protein
VTGSDATAAANNNTQQQIKTKKTIVVNLKLDTS